MKGLTCCIYDVHSESLTDNFTSVDFWSIANHPLVLRTSWLEKRILGQIRRSFLGFPGKQLVNLNEQIDRRGFFAFKQIS